MEWNGFPPVDLTPKDRNSLSYSLKTRPGPPTLLYREGNSWALHPESLVRTYSGPYTVKKSPKYRPGPLSLYRIGNHYLVFVFS
jgi:hypothetical protein